MKEEEEDAIEPCSISGRYATNEELLWGGIMTTIRLLFNIIYVYSPMSNTNKVYAIRRL
jgi:hypothetical protein